MDATMALAWACRALRATACLAALACASAAQAQTTGTLVGTVTDAASAKPVAGALVIATSPGLQGEQTAVTDARGQFTFTLLPPGRYKLVAQIQGYLPAERMAWRSASTTRSVQTWPSPRGGRAGGAGHPFQDRARGERRQRRGGRRHLEGVPGDHSDNPGLRGNGNHHPDRVKGPGRISLGGQHRPRTTTCSTGSGSETQAPNYLGSNLLTNFIDQIDVKTGGFLPEYGYSSGGVVNAVRSPNRTSFTVQSGATSRRASSRLPARWSEGTARRWRRTPRLTRGPTRATSASRWEAHREGPALVLRRPGGRTQL